MKIKKIMINLCLIISVCGMLLTGCNTIKQAKEKETRANKIAKKEAEQVNEIKSELKEDIQNKQVVLDETE